MHLVRLAAAYWQRCQESKIQAFKTKGSKEGQLVTHGLCTAIGARVHAVQALAKDAVQVAGHVGQCAVALQHVLDRSQAPLRACRRTCFRAGSQQAKATGERKV